MSEKHTLLTGLAFGESPRWHEGRLWFADWGAQEILAVNLEGKREVIVKVSFPSFKKAERQTSLEQASFNGSQISSRVFAKAPLLATSFFSLL